MKSFLQIKPLVLLGISKYMQLSTPAINPSFAECVEKHLLEKQKFEIMNELTLVKSLISVNSVELLSGN